MKYLKLYENKINNVFIRYNAPSGDIKIKIGDYINVIGEKNEEKYRIQNISNFNREYNILKRTFDDYYRLVPYRNNVSELLIDVLPVLRYVEDFDYIKEENDRENISYLLRNRIQNAEDKWNSNLRTVTRIGRFIRKILPNLEDKEIEKLTNIVKSVIKYDITDLQEVSGEKIRYWYNENHYAFEDKGTLGNSCMRYSDYDYKFDIYAYNPNKCKLIILLNDKNKLLARALLWNTDKGPYMDRVYFSNDYEENLYKRYAREKGYKTYYENNEDMIVKEVRVSSKECSDLPYMDTFKYVYRNFISSYRIKGNDLFVIADCT